jgi:predicted TIM-barrel fold metal-dependent hydrolase
MHCHTAGIGAGGSGCRVSSRMRRSVRYLSYLRAFKVTERQLRACGDGLVIEKISNDIFSSKHVDAAVVLAMDAAVDSYGTVDEGATELYVPTDFVVRETKKHPNLYAGASVHPNRKDACQRLHQAAEDGAVLVKWLPSIQGMDPADKRYTEFYKTLRELGLPLLTHTGSEYSFTRADDELSDPLRLRLPLELGVTVIAAHAASSGKNEGVANSKRLHPYFREFPNLYADISALTLANQVATLPRLISEADCEGRLLYGTDMPLLRTPVSSPIYFTPRLGLKRTRELMVMDNPWDQDVSLKRALGVPCDVFTRAAKVLNIGEVNQAKVC